MDRPSEVLTEEEDGVFLQQHIYRTCIRRRSIRLPCFDSATADSTMPRDKLHDVWCLPQSMAQLEHLVYPRDATQTVVLTDLARSAKQPILCNLVYIDDLSGEYSIEQLCSADSTVSMA